MRKSQFSEHLEQATITTKKAAQKYCWNKLPSGVTYFIRLNCSYDSNPLRKGEYRFPELVLPKDRSPQSFTQDEVIELLWRENKVPEWINILPFDVDPNSVCCELECCGRFTNQRRYLYHKPEGYPPFHAQIELPTCDYNLKRDGKFDLRWRKQKNP